MRGGLALAGAALLTGCGVVSVRSLWGAGPRRIGYLSAATPSTAAENYAAFRAGLADLGYVEGQGVVHEARYANERAERLPALAAELVALPVDVIVTEGNRAIAAARQATTTIPVVFTIANDPVADG